MSVKCDHGTAVPSPWLFEGNVPRTQAVLPRWTATEMRWRRKLVERTSLLTAAILRPISETSSRALSPHTPDVSTANGTKSTPPIILAYLRTFLASAVAAADPACELLAWTCDWANVFGQVASQARHLPCFHGTRVTPSGR